jgi:hypothetical protein
VANFGGANLSEAFITSPRGGPPYEGFYTPAALRKRHTLVAEIATVVSLNKPRPGEVALEFGTSGLVGRSLLQMGQDGAADYEDETED